MGHVVIACVLLVDPHGRLLLQLRDRHAPVFPDMWALPGGHVEPGETVQEVAARELWEETRLRPDGPLRPYAVQELPEHGRTKHYFHGTTRARPEEIVVGEGADILFVEPADLHDGRPYTPGTYEIVRRFLDGAR